MVIRVADIAEKAVGRENVYVATDDERISDVVKDNNYNVLMTSSKHPCCTDRVAEASTQINADIIVNLQGDEPMLNPNEIILAIDAKKQYPEYVINCVSPLQDFEKPENRNVIKMVMGLDDNLICASRNPIPVDKLGNAPICKKQVCIYAYNKEELRLFGEQGTTPLEGIEEVDILRFLEMNIPVKIINVSGDSHAVDIPEDIGIVEKLLRKGK